MESFLGALKNLERKTDESAALNMVRKMNILKYIFSNYFENRSEILKTEHLISVQLFSFKGIKIPLFKDLMRFCFWTFKYMSILDFLDGIFFERTEKFGNKNKRICRTENGKEDE
jgi:hypothetical protein